MTEHSYGEIDEPLPEAQSGELVHWMAARPLSLGPAGILMAVGGAFVLGLATAAITVAVLRLARPERRMSAPLERKLRRWS
jgi:hypothetical protein